MYLCVGVTRCQPNSVDLERRTRLQPKIAERVTLRERVVSAGKLLIICDLKKWETYSEPRHRVLYHFTVFLKKEENKTRKMTCLHT